MTTPSDVNRPLRAKRNAKNQPRKSFQPVVTLGELYAFGRYMQSLRDGSETVNFKKFEGSEAFPNAINKIELSLGRQIFPKRLSGSGPVKYAYDLKQAVTTPGRRENKAVLLDGEILDVIISIIRPLMDLYDGVKQRQPLLEFLKEQSTQFRREVEQSFPITQAIPGLDLTPEFPDVEAIELAAAERSRKKFAAALKRRQDAAKGRRPTPDR